MPNIAGSSDGPLLIAHFIVTIGGHPLPLLSVSELHDVLEDSLSQENRRHLVLKRSISKDRFLYNWYRDTKLGKDTVANITIDVLDAPGGRVANRWSVENARPVRWTGPGFNALGNEIAMEELEVAYESIVWLD